MGFRPPYPWRTPSPNRAKPFNKNKNNNRKVAGFRLRRNKSGRALPAQPQDRHSTLARSEKAGSQQPVPVAAVDDERRSLVLIAGAGGRTDRAPTVQARARGPVRAGGGLGAVAGQIARVPAPWRRASGVARTAPDRVVEKLIIKRRAAAEARREPVPPIRWGASE